MRILELFRGRKASSAQVAKERLQIIVSHESRATKDPDFIKRLQSELLGVISKYVNIDPNQIRVQLDRSGDQSILELNVTLPDAGELEALAAEKAAQDAKTETV